MQIPFQIINWSNLAETTHEGETGKALWKTIQYGDLRIRMIEYSPGYKADHWCEKGHIIFCIEGEMETELSDGSKHMLRAGMSYHVSDNMSSHKSQTVNGAKLLVIDGGFLK